MSTRTIDACSLCGSEVEYDADGPCCPGARIVPVQVFRPEPQSPAWTAADEARWQAAGEAERRRIYEGGVAEERRKLAQIARIA